MNKYMSKNSYTLIYCVDNVVIKNLEPTKSLIIE